MHIDWDLLPTHEIPLGLLVMDCRNLHPEHVHVTDASLTLSTGPIHVQQLLDGRYFIHNGRHRTLRALHRGAASITAKVY